MNKVYLGEYCGLRYYMADKVYHNLDWWEATALAEQMGGELPSSAVVEDYSEEIISHIGEGWESYIFWNSGDLQSDRAFATHLGKLKKVLGIYSSTDLKSFDIRFKSSKASVIVIFKEEKEESSQPPTHSKHFLKKALEVQDSRASEYDTDKEEERNMGKIVTAFNAITGHTLTEAEGYLFMETLKNVRLFGAPSFHEDSAVDGISYASLKAEAKAKEG